MIRLEDYISDKNIIFYLCRMRAKLAKNRNKKHLIHVLTNDQYFNYHIKELNPNEAELVGLFPKRKNWKKLGGYSRIMNGQQLNSIDKNIKSLIYTIDYYKKYKANDPVTITLNDFVKSIKSCIYNKHYLINTPETYPKPKDEKGSSPTSCRPISLFSLKDKIVICLINKYLTDVFDSYFYCHSYAFRSTKLVNGEKRVLSHHDAVRAIKEYLLKHPDGNLWVAECDIMKFYDTANHYVVKRLFNELIKKAKRDNQSRNLKPAIRIFNNYLNCYAFYKDVYTKNSDTAFFKKHGIKNGVFEWIEPELKKGCYYKSIEKERIGIPQGGALSGLIANIVLDYADKEVVKNSDKDLLYLRYCDDMLIIHPDKNKCLDAFRTYSTSLRDLKLIPHSSYQLDGYGKEFWSVKSKYPYLWGSSSSISNSSPWIGFVGYEINRTGDTRVRKKSLKKEMKKQFDTIKLMKRAINQNSKRASNKTIEESARNKLNGFSVGRIKLWNYHIIKNELCWVNGFSELTYNKYSSVQIKMLDRCKNKLLRKFERYISSTS